MPQYQGIWTLAQAAQLQSTQRWATDPLYRNTTLLLQADNAANGAQNNTFFDSSTNSFPITRFGNTTQGTFTPFSQSPGWWGNYFDGSSYLQTGSSVSIGTSVFTLEFWVYATDLTSDRVFVAMNGGATDRWVIGQINTPAFVFRYEGVNDIAFSSPLTTNRWNHIAVVREGTGTNQTKLYLNGILSGTGTVPTNYPSTAINIGAGRTPGTLQTIGYLSNVRLVIGTAVYTSNFTPSPIPLTAVTNTSLLTCQSNRFVDNSTNNFTFTVNGSPSVQAFSPFAPQYQWTAPVIGGSGYFDGSGDYLDTGVQSNLYLNASDYTIEFWAYFTRAPGTANAGTLQAAIAQGDGSWFGNNNEHNWLLLFDNGTFAFGKNPNFYTLSYTPPLYTWMHYAIVGNSSGSITMYVNGVSQGTQTGRTALGSASWSTRVGLGFYGDTKVPNYFQGYMSGVRIVKGTQVYTGNFTPPTAPLTAITNTQLLLNYTNAAIYDGTMKNNLETVGNAQVNTSVVKYGTGSMAFDGSGDYLVVGNMATTPNLALGSGDFTIEYWYYPLNTNIHASLNNLDDSAGTGSLWILMNGTFSGGSKVQFGYNTGSISNILFGTGTFATNQWYHIAITRQGSAMRCFINGVQEGATNTGIGSGSIQSFNRNLVIGATLSSGTYSVYNLNGYLDDFRITKGIARYTANFTPPTVALPRQ